MGLHSVHPMYRQQSGRHGKYAAQRSRVLSAQAKEADLRTPPRPCLAGLEQRSAIPPCAVRMILVCALMIKKRRQRRLTPYWESAQLTFREERFVLVYHVPRKKYSVFCREALSRRAQRGWTEARARGGPQGPDTSPNRREAARREQAKRDSLPLCAFL